MYVSEPGHMSGYMDKDEPWRLEEGIGPPGTGVQVTMSYHVSAESQTQVLCKSGEST